MINAARTLLLNRDGNTRPPASYFLEEYVDPSYRALTLPSYLRASYGALIGNADDAYANFRLWQYMRILHSTEFASYALALDPRVTYLHDRSVVNTGFEASYEPVTPPAVGPRIFFVGSVAPNPAAPKLAHTWLLEAGGALLLRVTDVSTGKFADNALTFTSELSSLVPLTGETDFFLRITGSSLPVGAKWLISAFASPVGDLSELEARLRQVSVTDAFFPYREPFLTFKKLWEAHPFLQYRLSGFLLAHIYGVEEVRLNGQ